MMLPSTDPLHALIVAARKADVDEKKCDAAQRCLDEIIRRGDIDTTPTKTTKIKTKGVDVPASAALG